MVRNLLAICAVSALAASALLPASVDALEFTKVYDAYANLSDAPSGCELVYTVIDVVEYSYREDGERRTEHTLRFYFRSSNYDFCEDRLVWFVEGTSEIPPSAFRSQALKSATLQATVFLEDQVIGAPVPVAFDLTWICDPTSISGRFPNGACESAPLSGSILLRGDNLVGADAYSEGQLVSFNKW